MITTAKLQTISDLSHTKLSMYLSNLVKVYIKRMIETYQIVHSLKWMHQKRPISQTFH